MRKIITILSVISAMLFIGCRHNSVTYPEVLLTADSLASNGNPDSAVALLEQIAPQMAGSSEEVRHYYELLTIKARDKANLPFESDSLVISTVSYYENGGDAQCLPEAYYYMGRFLSDLGDAPQALEYFQKATDVIKSEPFSQFKKNNSFRTNKLLGLLYAQSGYLLKKQHIYNDALNKIETSFYYDSINHDTLAMIMNLLDLGQIFQAQEHYDKALYYYDLSEKLALSINDTTRAINATCQEIHTLVVLKRYDEAKKYFYRYPFKYANQKIGALSAIIGNMYSKIGNKDSAAFYFNKCIQIGTLPQQAHSHIWLANNDIKEKKVESAISHLKKYIAISETINDQQEAETTALTNSLYNYNLREKENLILRHNNKQYRSYVTIGFLLLILLSLLLSITIYFIIHNRKTATKQRNRIKYYFEAKERENEKTILENKQKLEKLEYELHKAASCNLQLSKEYDALSLLIKHAEINNTFNTSLETQIENSHAYSIIIEKMKNGKVLNENDWNEIECQITHLNPNILARLRSIYDFSEIEWHTTLLIKLKINPSNIAGLIGRSGPNITMIRTRLYKKVFLKEGTAKEWDEFIASI